MSLVFLPTPVFSHLFFFWFCLSSSYMLPNLLRCKCLREARFLAFPRGTLVLLCPLPASTQTRAQTVLLPRARYCTGPGPLGCRKLCSQDGSLKWEGVVAKQPGRIQLRNAGRKQSCLGHSKSWVKNVSFLFVSAL